MIGQRTRCIGRGNVAADDLYVWVVFLDPLHAIQHALRMTMRRIDDDHVHTGFGQQLNALFRTGTHADGRARAQATRGIFRCIRVFGGFEDIFDGNQTVQLVFIIDHQHALDAMLVHQRLGVFDAAAFAYGD